MTQEERQSVGEYWLGLAQMYGKDINRIAMKIMLDSVDDLPADGVVKALEGWARTSKLGRHPLPADIRDVINPPVDDRAVAIVLARKIDKAVSKHGWAWDHGIMGSNGIYFEGGGKVFSTWKEAVIEELGPIGWATISQKGGWLQTRNSANEMDEQGFIAQTRDQIQANMQLERQGVDLARLEMPKPSANEGSLQLTNIQKLITIKDLK
jgi:hypothetical protein